MPRCSRDGGRRAESQHPLALGIVVALLLTAPGASSLAALVWGRRSSSVVEEVVSAPRALLPPAGPGHAATLPAVAPHGAAVRKVRDRFT